MYNEVQGSPASLVQDDEAIGGVGQSSHPELDLELRGTPTTHH